MDSITASTSDTDTLGTNPVTPEPTQAGSDTANVGTDEVTPQGEAVSSSTTPDSSTPPTETAEDRLTRQLGERFQQATPPAQPAAQPTTTQAQQQQQLTLQAVQEALGLKSVEDLKRFQNQTSLFGRQANELGQARKQLQDLYQQQHADKQRQEQEAAKQNLSPFHAKHPQYYQNRERIIRAQGYLAEVSGKSDPNEIRAAAARHGVTQQDVDMAYQAKAYSENVQAELQRDPEGFIESRAERAIQTALQKYDQYLNSRNEAQSFVNKHQDLIADPKAQQLMDRALDPSTSRSDLAIEIARLTKERDELLAKAHQTTGETEALKARQELSARQTFTSRRASTSTTTHVDPSKAYQESARKDPNAASKYLDALLGQR